MSYWNEHKGAVSLTFDDGLPEHLTYAIPELNRFGIKGTFFVIQCPEKTKKMYDACFRTTEWQKTAANGHEIGGHSVTHLYPQEVDANITRACAEIEECKNFLTKNISPQITSYAYPYTYSNQAIIDSVKQHFKQARGMNDSRGEDKYIIPGDNRNIFNLPSFQTNEDNLDMAEQWFIKAENEGAWIILMFHGIGPNKSRYDNIGTEKFHKLLSLLKTKNLWIAPFGTVAEKYKESLIKKL